MAELTDKEKERLKILLEKECNNHELKELEELYSIIYFVPFCRTCKDGIKAAIKDLKECLNGKTKSEN